MPENNNTNSTNFSDYREKLESFFNKYFVEKLPPMTSNLKEGIVTYGPYVAAVICAFSVIFLIQALFSVLFAASISATTGDGFRAIRVLLAFALLIPIIILEAYSIPGLLKRSKSKGWNFMFYAFLLDLLYTIVVFDVIGFFIRLVLMYGLFQIRNYYRD